MVGNQTLPTASCLVPRMVTAPGMTSLGEKTLGCDVELRVRFTCSVNVHACPMSRGRNGPGPNARSLSIMCAEYEKKPPRASEDPENPAARTVPGARDPRACGLPRTRTRHASRWGPGAEQPALRANKTFIPVYHLGGPRPSSTPIPQIKSQFTEGTRYAHTYRYVPRSVFGIL